MAGRVHLVRHSEAVHNTDHDFSRLDPELTLVGQQQAEGLANVFPASDEVGLIVTSPLRRTIQTTLLAFANVLDERYFDQGSGKGVAGGAELVLDPGLQERSALPCDTGSDPRVLEATFPSLDFSGLGAGWQVKEGLYSPDAVEDRARNVRQYLADNIEALKDRNRRDIVVVTHGVFMKVLSGDPEIDLPKAGWRSYSIEQGEEGNVVLVST
ncbi:histidine phosphatase superfamily [Lipomyces tetrasporus]|uniref:Histidine phosphatase superfamily n=1 Tax=Lipomyces tetrasporus TaxID=54092 RepID=A0AAD7QKG5_9ASCO|nr:histidine phosphatase superfamily [Lipomyces tetrasporus]KAJ8096501.1 histidine phosphatase superfamily [Lipomyces tetrasporus]